MTERRETALHARHLAGPVVGLFARPIFTVVVGVYSDLPTSRACQGLCLRLSPRMHTPAEALCGVGRERGGD